jgi:hypothetical protein
MERRTTRTTAPDDGKRQRMSYVLGACDSVAAEHVVQELPMDGAR